MSEAGAATFSGKAIIDPADGIADDAYALFVRNNEATAGRNYGAMVRGGSNSSDEAFTVRNYDNSSTYFTVRGDGAATFGGQLLPAAGAVSAPSYSFDGDTNTGISRPTGDAVNIVTGGAERVRVNSTGVGIGTTSPSSHIHISSASSPTLRLTDTTNTVQALYYAQDADAHLGTYSNHDLIFDTNSAERMRIDSSGNVQIGSTSSDGRLKIAAASGNSAAAELTLWGNNAGGFGGTNIAKSKIDSVTDGTAYGSILRMYTNDTSNNYQERVRIDSTGLGIGTSSPRRQIHLHNSASATTKLMITNGATGESNDGQGFQLGIDSSGNALLENRENTNLILSTNNTQRMTITSGGDVGVGVTPDAWAGTGEAIQLGGSGHLSTSDSYAYINSNAYYGSGWKYITSSTAAQYSQAAGTHRWSTAASGTADAALSWSEKLRIGTAGELQLGGTTNAGFVDFDGQNLQLNTQRNPNTGTFVNTGFSHAGLTLLGSSGGSSIKFYTAAANNTVGTERMMLNKDGQLLVGTSSINPQSGSSNTGVQIGDGHVYAGKDGAGCLILNRHSSNGEIAEFRRDGTTVGSIGTNTGSDFYIASTDGTGVVWDATSMIPATDTGAGSDNAKDLGQSSFRWDDVYATNGTINTSDRNEKQDIEELSDAEQRVAVACKGLLRKFRWKSSVADKGDDARIHFGIIAQDLQAAFEAEGLDAGRYGMFISSTWTDEDGNEQTRLGVRYSELLAFIISAI